MNKEQVEAISKVVEELKSYLNLTVDNKGNNLHDIKFSFDYVMNTIKEHNLESTIYGENLKNQVEQAGNILSQLYTCLENLIKVLDTFCNDQGNTNNRTS